VNRKRIIGLIVAAATLAALSGCSAGSDSGKTEVVIWDPGILNKINADGKVDKKTAFLDAAAADYEKANPGVTIKVVETPTDITTNTAQFQAASLAGNGPDIKVGNTGGGTDSFAKYFIDLDDVLSSKVKDDLTGWDTVRQGYTSDGKLLALPYGAGSYFYVFYNKEKAAADGIDIAEASQTWESLMDAAKTIKAKGDIPFWMGDQEGYVGAWAIAALAGGELGSSAFTDMYNGTTKIDSPAMLKAYKAFAALNKDGLTNPDAGSLAMGDSSTGFLQGKGVFFIAGGWMNQQFADTMGDNVGVFAIPMFSDAKYPDAVAGGTNEAISITTYAKQPAAAKKFLEYLAQPSTIDMFVKMNQSEASNSKSADLSLITNPLLKEQAQQLKTVKTLVFPFDNVMPQSVIDTFYKVNATTFLGTTTPQDALTQLQSAFTTASTK
jgi:raffinose/stachyose/melibiose transport system substrate-binding protein